MDCRRQLLAQTDRLESQTGLQFVVLTQPGLVGLGLQLGNLFKKFFSGHHGG